jgi:hypothetical protein
MEDLRVVLRRIEKLLVIIALELIEFVVFNKQLRKVLIEFGFNSFVELIRLAN